MQSGTARLALVAVRMMEGRSGSTPGSAAPCPCGVIDLVRDPRDVLCSIRAFTATGQGEDGFGSPYLERLGYPA